jgi:hypothetical protein
VPPTAEPLKFTRAELTPLQSVWFVTAFTDGRGLTVIVNVCTGPEQLLEIVRGVTDIVAVRGDEDVFAAVNEVILPEPLMPSPILVLLLVQL